MRLLSFIVRRLVAMVFILIGVAAITFLLVRLAPGDPVVHAAWPACRRRGRPTSAFITRWAWINRYGDSSSPMSWNALHGDLGQSMIQLNTPVTDIIGQGLPITLELGALATVVALVWASRWA